MNNCPNCGAPIEGFECPYCGATFYDFATLSFDKPVYMRLRAMDGQIVLMKLHLFELNIEMSQDESVLYADGEAFMVATARPEARIHMGFREMNRRSV